MGEKNGAALLAASATLEFGAGLVTLVGKNRERPKNLKADFMYDGKFEAGKFNVKKFTSIAIGQGLGRKNDELFSILKMKETQSMPMVINANIFYYAELKKILPKLSAAVLTPHPKEFSSLLITGISGHPNEGIIAHGDDAIHIGLRHNQFAAREQGFPIGDIDDSRTAIMEIEGHATTLPHNICGGHVLHIDYLR